MPNISFDFDDEYFEDEVRCDFKITSLMKRCFAAGMRTVEDISKVCDKYNIKWYAFCGTLLGAVRHKGFVPWDDDIDICMMREDYEKFLAVAKKELPKFYTVETYNEIYRSDKQTHIHIFDGISRINTTQLPDFDKDIMDYFYGFPYPCGVDLYPMDYLPDNSDVRAILQNIDSTIFLAIESVANDLNHEFDKFDSRKISTQSREYIEKIKMLTGQDIPLDENLLLRLPVIFKAISTMYKKEECSSVACMTHFARGHAHMIFDKNDFEESLTVPFETGEVIIPKGYDNILKINYGAGYMTPVVGSYHDYPYYKKWEMRVKNYAKKNPDVQDIMTSYFYPDV